MDAGDPVKRWAEIQDNRYNPGYWTGGKIDPLLTAARPNKYGVMLLVSAFVLLVQAGLGESSWEVLFIVVLSGVLVAAGLRLAFRKRRRVRDRHGD